MSTETIPHYYCIAGVHDDITDNTILYSFVHDDITDNTILYSVVHDYITDNTILYSCVLFSAVILVLHVCDMLCTDLVLPR